MSIREKFHVFAFVFYHTVFPGIRQEKNRKCGSTSLPHGCKLLLAEGLAVGALILGRINLVGAHQNPVQGAVVLGVAVVSAGLNGAFDALVCMAVHIVFLLLIWYGLSMGKTKDFMQEIFDIKPVL